MKKSSAHDDCCYRAVDLFRIGPRLFGLRDMGDLYEARTGCSFCIHCMAGIAICADVAGNGSRLRRIGRNADTPGVGASLTVFSISSSLKITAIFSQGPVCDADVFPPPAGQF